MDLLTCIKAEATAYRVAESLIIFRSLQLHSTTRREELAKDAAGQNARDHLATLAALMGFSITPIEAEAAKDAA